MSQNSDKHPHKIFNDLLGKEGVIENYDYFLSDEMKRIKLTSIDKENLEKFLDAILNVVGGAEKVEGVDDNNPSVQVDLFVPKLPSVPITSASMKYTYIIRQPTPTARGLYGDFSASLERKDAETPWLYSKSTIGYGYKASVQTNFSTEDFSKLGLKFVEKFFLSDLEAGKQKLDFTPLHNYKSFTSSGWNSYSYAFYRFTTTRNSVPLTVIFGVEKDKYNEQETTPKDWFIFYAKRD